VRGYDLVAMIFVREIDDELTGLVRKLDECLDESMAKHKPQDRLGVFVILLGNDAKQQQKLKDWVNKDGPKQVVLCTDVNGEQRNKVAKEAAVTVAVYRDHNQVSANFALKKGELDCQKAGAIYAAIDKVVPK
jgi:hypothetical protein